MVVFRILPTVLWITATAALAQQSQPDTIEWKTVGTWTIYVDRTVGNACYTVTLYEDYTIFRLGFQERGSANVLYVGLGNSEWRSLEIGKEYNLVLQVDNEPGWNSPATAGEIGGIPFLFVGTNQAEFVDQLRRKHSLRVYFNKRMILNLSLRGSAAALTELGRCQDAVDTYLNENDRRPPAGRDPFSGSSSPAPSRDPFAL